MKRFLYLLLPFCICFFMLGAASEPAPVLPTTGFYVNDYFAVLGSGNRDFILETSWDLNEQTNTRVVVLTVPDLMDLDRDSYLDLIIRGWKLDEDKDILIFLTGHDNSAAVVVGDDFRQSIDGDAVAAEAMAKYLEKGNLQSAVMEGYKDVITKVYAHYNLEPTAQLQEKLQPETGPKVSTGSFLIITAAGIFILLRGFSIHRTYRRRTARNRAYQRKTFVSERKAFDESEHRDTID